VQLPVSPQERFLDQIFGVLFVASHAKSKTEQGMAVAFDKDTKGLLIAFACLGGSLCVCPFHPAGP
jgi:hypothetical protein